VNPAGLFFDQRLVPIELQVMGAGLFVVGLYCLFETMADGQAGRRRMVVFGIICTVISLGTGTFIWFALIVAAVAA